MPPPDRYLARLTNKSAIVSGAGNVDEIFLGTGAAIAILFACEGASLCVVDRDIARAQTTCRIIERQGGRAIPIEADVTSNDDCQNVVGICEQHFGTVDILVNNVGVVDGRTTPDDFESADWDRIIATNLKSAVLMSLYAIPVMQAAGRGSIVNISSIAGLQGFGGGMAYAPSKAALIGLTRETAVRHGRDGIRANVVAPGHVYTPMVADGIDEAKRVERRKAAPLGIEGDAWDIAAATLFFASDEARFITGACLAVDGGVTQIGALVSHALISKP